ncbi:hypothetical protein M501DRAFT_981511, partial [Patellaria atrata CBS 101060]
MVSLTIPVTPFKPSHLSIPPSPFSPRYPLTPSPSPPARKTKSIFSRKESTFSPLSASGNPPPAIPLRWLWQCHQCHSSYSLGVTRRCLDDGHYFCAGQTTVKSWRKSKRRRTKKHKACASEFDYAGWKAWGDWRREELEYQSSVSMVRKGASRAEVFDTRFAKGKDCWGRCDYPSECRWGSQYGVQTSTKSDAKREHKKEESRPQTTFVGILGENKVEEK